MLLLLQTIFTLLLTLTAASPTTLTRRGLAGAYYTCTGNNFSGQCSWTAPNTSCRIQGSPGIKSLGPDADTLCTLSVGTGCSGKVAGYVRFPGQASGLPAFGSFKCKKEGNWARGPEVVEEVDELDVKEFGALKKVEKEGREEGMIGLEKGTYY
jgi:hypothetical protein